MVKEYRAEERRRAAEQIYAADDAAQRIYTFNEFWGEVQALGGLAAIDLQCELNRAVELLRDAPVTGRHEWAQRNADFLSRYPEGDKQ